MLMCKLSEVDLLTQHLCAESRSDFVLHETQWGAEGLGVTVQYETEKWQASPLQPSAAVKAQAV